MENDLYDLLAALRTDVVRLQLAPLTAGVPDDPAASGGDSFLK